MGGINPPRRPWSAADLETRYLESLFASHRHFAAANEAVEVAVRARTGPHQAIEVRQYLAAVVNEYAGSAAACQAAREWVAQYPSVYTPAARAALDPETAAVVAKYEAQAEPDWPPFF